MGHDIVTCITCLYNVDSLQLRTLSHAFIASTFDDWAVWTSRVQCAFAARSLSLSLAGDFAQRAFERNLPPMQFRFVVPSHAVHWFHTFIVQFVARPGSAAAGASFIDTALGTVSCAGFLRLLCGGTLLFAVLAAGGNTCH